MLKASCWAGNVGELAKQSKSHQLPAVPAFTPLPYYRVYRSAFTPLGPPTLHTLQAHGRESEEESGEKENKHEEKQVTAHRGGAHPTVGFYLQRAQACPPPGNELA